MKHVKDMTRDELRAEAKELEIPGRGSMKVAELREAVDSVRQGRAIGQIETVFTDEDGCVNIGFTDEGMTRERGGGGSNMDSLERALRQMGVITAGPGQYFYAHLPPKRNRYRDRVERRQLVVRTPNGQAPTMSVRVRRDRPAVRSMPTKTRVMHYVKQNGVGQLTPRQERQVRRMRRRNATLALTR